MYRALVSTAEDLSSIGDMPGRCSPISFFFGSWCSIGSWRSFAQLSDHSQDGPHQRSGRTVCRLNYAIPRGGHHPPAEAGASATSMAPQMASEEPWGHRIAAATARAGKGRCSSPSAFAREFVGNVIQSALKPRGNLLDLGSFDDEWRCEHQAIADYA